MMCVIDSEDELREILQEEEEIYIYGEGKIAKAILSSLSYKEMVKIIGVIVTKANPILQESERINEVSDVVLRRDVMVLNLTGKPHKLEIEKKLIEEGFERSVKLSDNFEEIVNKQIQTYPNILLLDVVQYVERVHPRKRLKTLVVNICNHCNLNCRGCDHFSPIAEKEFNSIEEIRNDLSRIYSILYENIRVIAVMGGEPLLHPELNAILENARRIFPSVSIWLCTNGIALLHQTEDFWKCCHDNDIEINVTKYPIDFDYDKAEKLAEEHGVKFMYYHGGLVEKTLGHYPLDLQGKQEAEGSFMRCFHANNTCNMLNHGRLYPCTVAPCIPIFNEKYGCNIPLTKEDGIDIYNVADEEKLLEVLSKPMPICKYCNVENRTFGHTWGRSCGDIKEWS